jgi:uncharacterized membrane-anchored protein
MDYYKGQAEHKQKEIMSEVAIPAFPSKLRRLKEWALGDGLATWSEEFQPSVTSAADSLLETLKKSITETSRQLSDLHDLMRLEILPALDQYEQEDRLLNTLDRQINMLGKLSGIHNKLTAVGVAAMVAALTRPNIKDLPGDGPGFQSSGTVRDVTPRRALGQ